MAQYVNNKALLESIIVSKAQNELTPEALKMISLMISGVSKIFKYKMEEDREDCEAFAMEDVIKYWDRFDPEKSSNAFAYYTQMIKNGFAKGLRRLYPIKSSLKVSISKEYGVYNILFIGVNYNNMVIYKTINNINGKFYIGKDTNNNTKYLGSGTYLRNAIKKYGIENFTKEILEHCNNNEELCEREIYWIKKLDARNPEIAYNISTGGDGWNKESASIAAKIGNANRTTKERKQTASYIWSKLTPEQKSEKAKLIWKNISAEEHSEISKLAWSKFTKEEISELRKETWENFSDESRAQHSDSIKKSWENDSERKKKHADILNESKKKLTKEQRSEIARNAVAGRWKKLREKKLLESQNGNT